MIVIASDPSFSTAASKKEVDEFVKRSLYQRTLGYS